MSTAVTPRLTPEQYLERERRSPVKNEYDNGIFTEMAGASRRHNLITINLARELSGRLLDRPCEVYASDMRLLVDATGLYTYPDVMAVCGAPRFLDGEVDTLLNPEVIVEVLSPTTEADDRGRKFTHYRRLESLREYVLVAQDRIAVERYTRRGEEWAMVDLDGPEAVLVLESVGCEVPLREIYAKVHIDVAGA